MNVDNGTSDEIFIVMQIGNADLDVVCDEALIPAITDAGFTPRRVDRHNTGDLLKSEIVQFIERSQIIVADLTNERPNCYLEIGYAMGLGKKANLILTAREDHHWSSPQFSRDGPRIHFDLEGYDILFWNPDGLPEFKKELTQRIRRRAAIVRDAGDATQQLPEDVAWWKELRARGEAGITNVGLNGYMEVFAQIQPAETWQQNELLTSVREASVNTFGWPIAVVLDNRDDFRPHPTSDGIEAEVASDGNDGRLHRASYDLWKLFRDGRFYTMVSMFEDSHAAGSIFWDTRINRVTEALLLLVRLYRRLGASDTDQVRVWLRHSGLASRTLRVANSNRITRDGRTSDEDVVESAITISLNEMEAGMAELVKQLVAPLFMVFDFFKVEDDILTDIVDGLVAGEVR